MSPQPIATDDLIAGLLPIPGRAGTRSDGVTSVRALGAHVVHYRVPKPRQRELSH